ncbi:hypothetical protein BDA96_01G275500 [Sorghum bicolor]|uniref:PRA1 family protein n=1 Tax=Sorghum bicolor TaxID=4558 RepID=A0A921S1K0_SORBI|nr:hypothetical protein BDA96_01G275500 [Sorghum bicolor]
MNRSRQKRGARTAKTLLISLLRSPAATLRLLALQATSRLWKNLVYFRVNYAAVTALCLAASLLVHPFSLAMLLAAWCLLYELRPADAPPVAAFCRTFSDREVLGGLVAASAFVVFLTSVGSLIFSALALGAAVVCAHGACRVPADQAAGGARNPLLCACATTAAALCSARIYGVPAAG